MLRRTLFGIAALSALSAGALSADTLVLDFNSAGSGGILDSTGASTGFTTRLSGTGGSLASDDPTLTLNTGSGVLTMSTTQSDFNGGAGLATGSMPGINLSSLGYTGTQDFYVTAVFGPISGVETIDQVGLFIGADGANLTRAGTIVFATPEYFSGHTNAGSDTDGRFYGFGINVADGMTVTISRTAGVWTYTIDGVQWHPNTVGDGTGTNVDPDGTNNSPNLTGLSDLTVGVYAITPLNSNVKTVNLQSFTASVVPEPSTYAALAGLAVIGVALRRRRSHS